MKTWRAARSEGSARPSAEPTAIVREQWERHGHAIVRPVRPVKDGRRVLAAWIVGGQLLALPCLGLGAMMGALAIRPESDPATRVMVFSLPLLAEGMVAFAVALALRARLARRVSYSPTVVALASCAGMVVALLVAWAALMAWQGLLPGFDSDAFGLVAAGVAGVLLITASGVGVLLATRGGSAP
jgi:hypothetical protein